MGTDKTIERLPALLEQREIGRAPEEYPQGVPDIFPERQQWDEVDRNRFMPQLLKGLLQGIILQQTSIIIHEWLGDYRYFHMCKYFLNNRWTRALKRRYEDLGTYFLSR